MIRALRTGRRPVVRVSMSTKQISYSLIAALLADDPVLTDDVTAILQTSPVCNVILDFAGVGYVNSANLSLLLRLRQHLKDNDRALTIRSIQPVVWKSFVVTGLDQVFDIEK